MCVEIFQKTFSNQTEANSPTLILGERKKKKVKGNKGILDQVDQYDVMYILYYGIKQAYIIIQQYYNMKPVCYNIDYSNDNMKLQFILFAV